jgi:hypothetical protein
MFLVALSALERAFGFRKMRCWLLVFAVAWGSLLSNQLRAGPLDEWTRCNSPVGDELRGVTFGNNRFVAVGVYGVIIASSDGTNWATRASGSSSELSAIAFGHGEYNAGGANQLLNSTDSVSWWALHPGGDWEQYPPYYFGIAYGGGYFVIVGDNGQLGAFTPLPRHWSGGYVPTAWLRFYAVAYEPPNQFLAVGQLTGAQVLLAKIVVTWINTVTGPNLNLQTTYHSVPGKTLFGVAYGTNQFVAVGQGGRILSTPEGPGPQGLVFTNRVSGITNDLYAITYGHNLFVAVGDQGAVVSSPDGMVWTSHDSGSTNTLNGIAYGNGYFVAVGESGTVLRSGSTFPTSDQIKITGLQIVNGALSLGFTASPADSPGAFKVLSATQPPGPYSDTGVKATGANGVFQANVPGGVSARFYRVQK